MHFIAKTASLSCLARRIMALSKSPLSTETGKKSWAQAFKAYLDPRALVMLLLGFSSGLPYLLIFSSLSIWLKEAGFDIKVITMFSWAMLGYSFKFVWSPLVNAVPIPLITKQLGQRRSWLLVAQVIVAFSIIMLGSFNPTSDLILDYMAFFAVLLGFSAATQDIVIDAYRIEIAEKTMQPVLSGMFMAGYRLGLIAAGAGALFLAEYLGSTKTAYSYAAWQQTYYMMASLMTVGIVTTLAIKEPRVTRSQQDRPMGDYLQLFLLFLVSVIALVSSFIVIGNALPDTTTPLQGFIFESIKFLGAVLMAMLTAAGLLKAKLIKKQVAVEMWVAPIQDFFIRYGKKAVWLILLIGLYRISDIVAGTTSNLFYVNLGFSKTDIALAVKTFGMGMSILGGILGGLLAGRFKIMNAMLMGAILASSSNLLFVMLAGKGHDFFYMYFAVMFDNLASGLASAIFVAFLSVLTNIRFSMVQYALLSSLMTLTPKILGGYSGAMVENMGYASFFTFTALIGVPVLFLIYMVDKHVMGEHAKFKTVEYEDE
jgi:PAT family beta-lactamase induction signal transducer AmpG